MTPKEKTIELINKFEPFVDYEGDDCFTEREKMLKNAKQCALIAVDECYSEINTHTSNDNRLERMQYWREVKQEIENI